MVILSIIGPIVGIVFLGWLAKYFKIARPSWISVLNNFIYYISLPAIITQSFWETNWRSFNNLLTVEINSVVVIFYALLLALFLFFTHFSNRTKATIILISLTGNTVYMGFPIAQNAFSADYFPTVVASAAPHLVLGLIFGLIAAEYIKHQSFKLSTILDKLLKNPLILSIVVGIFLHFLYPNYSDTFGLKKTINMLSSTASPLALFALGEFMFGKIKAFFSYEALLLSVAKLFLLPLFTGLTLMLFNFNPQTIAVSTLMSAMPTAITAFVISERYQLDNHLVVGSITISTILSFFTLSFLLLVLGH